MGRGGYTVAKLLNNLTVNHDGDFNGVSIFDAIISSCATSTNKLDRCFQALGTSQQPAAIFIDVGVNDVGFVPPWALPDQTTWQNNYIAVLDTVHAQWPDPLIYVTKPWKRQSGGNETLFDTMASWVDNVVAARSSFARVGDDERAWFAPNASTYSDDWIAEPGTYIHWNAVGSLEKARQMQAVLGY